MAPAGFGQANGAGPAAARLEFEVASIKPSAPITSGAAKMQIRFGMRVDAGRMEYSYGSLRDFIRTAYQVKEYQISGPDWLNSARFDIVAKLPEGAAIDRVPAMLQALLADRFKLSLHRETKEHAVYALLVGKNGAKLQTPRPDVQADPGDDPKAASREIAVAAQAKRTAEMAADNAKASMTTYRMTGSGVLIDARKVTLPAFADLLSRYLDRPVVDMTEIQGVYDFKLEAAPEEMMRMKGAIAGAAGVDMGKAAAEAQATDPASNTTLLQAMQKYGLRLDPRKAPMDILVIDWVERTATEN